MKLHLGCGNRYIPGFVHIDVLELPHIDHCCDVSDLGFITDNSVKLIYGCHVIEHFNIKKASDVLKEWYRILTPGGIIRLSVPDFKTCAELYLAGKASLKQIHGPLMGGQTYLYNFHYSLFDEKKLTDLLTIIGFTNIHRWDWRNTEHATVDDYSQAYLPHMNKEHGTLISLNIEGIK